MKTQILAGSAALAIVFLVVFNSRSVKSLIAADRELAAECDVYRNSPLLSTPTVPFNESTAAAEEAPAALLLQQL